MFNIPVKQSSILSIWAMMAALMLMLAYDLLWLLIAGNFQAAEHSNSYINNVVEVADNINWRLVLLIALVSFCISFATIIQLDKKGIQQIKEITYGCKYMTIILTIVNIIWLLMAYLSQFEYLEFLIRKESVVLIPASAVAILYTLYTCRGKRSAMLWQQSGMMSGVSDGERQKVSRRKSEIFNVMVKRLLILYILQMGFVLMGFLIIFMFNLALDESIIADYSNIYVAGMVEVINKYWSLILWCACFNLCFLYIQMVRWCEEGIQEIRYKKMRYRYIFILKLLTLVYISWSLIY